MENINNQQLSFEIWKWIPKYEGRFEVSNRGRVRSWIKCIGSNLFNRKIYLSTPVIKKQVKHPRGYFTANIGNFSLGDHKYIRVHSVVALVFVPNPKNLQEPNHLNGVKDCNEWWNLEWESHIGNIHHAFETGLVGLCLGENQSQTKLKNAEVLSIFNSNEKTKFLSELYNVSYHTILDIKRGRTWAHLTGIKRHLKPSEKGKFKKDY